MPYVHVDPELLQFQDLSGLRGRLRRVRLGSVIDAELPKEGSTFERANLDLKGHPKAYFDGAAWKTFEMAKDAASFANTGGGRLLVGASEAKGGTAQAGTIEKYNPISSADALAFKNEFERAVFERCKPAPYLDIAPTPRDGGFIVVINVAPVPGALVGVRVAAGDDHYAGPAFVFPRRVGSQTEYLTPEHVAMYTDTAFRRIVALLGAVNGTVRLHYIEPHRSSRTFTTVIIDESANCLLLKGQGVTDESFALDAVENVWRDAKGWHIALSARYVQMGNE